METPKVTGRLKKLSTIIQNRAMGVLTEYWFKFENGCVKKLTEDGSKRFAKEEMLKIIDRSTCAASNYASKEEAFNNRKVKIRDSFTPGFQVNIQKYCGSYGEYQRELKNMGLVERGRDFVPTEYKHESNFFESYEAVKALAGTRQFSDRELDAIKDGEYTKGVTVN